MNRRLVFLAAGFCMGFVSWTHALEIEYVSSGVTLEPAIAAGIQHKIEAIVLSYQKLTGALPGTTEPIKLRLFDDFASYKTYQKSVTKTRSDKGCYVASLREIVLYKEAGSDAYQLTLFHEFCHWFLHQFHHPRVRWLDEGLAEYYETIYHDSEEMAVAVPHEKEKILRLVIRKTGDFPLEMYLNLSNKDWKKKDVSGDDRTRASAWSVVSFLMSHPQGLGVLRQLVAQQKQILNHPEESTAIIAKNYPGGFEVFLKDWKLWVLNRKDRQALHA